MSERARAFARRAVASLRAGFLLGCLWFGGLLVGAIQFKVQEASRRSLVVEVLTLAWLLVSPFVAVKAGYRDKTPGVLAAVGRSITALLSGVLMMAALFSRKAPPITIQEAEHALPLLGPLVFWLVVVALWWPDSLPRRKKQAVVLGAVPLLLALLASPRVGCALGSGPACGYVGKGGVRYEASMPDKQRAELRKVPILARGCELKDAASCQALADALDEDLGRHRPPHRLDPLRRKACDLEPLHPRCEPFLRPSYFFSRRAAHCTLEERCPEGGIECREGLETCVKKYGRKRLEPSCARLLPGARGWAEVWCPGLNTETF